MTNRTSLDIRLILCSLAAAVRALLIPLDGNLLGHALSNFLQCKTDSSPDITSPLDTLLRTASATEAAEAGKAAEAAAVSAEIKAGTKQILKDIIDVKATESAGTATEAT